MDKAASVLGNWPSLAVGRARGSLLAGAVLAGVVVLAWMLTHHPWVATGAVLGTAVLVLALMRPLVVVGLMLLLGPVDLSFATGGFKSFFEAMGGLDMNGIRLIGVVASFTAITLVDRAVLRNAFGREGRWYLLFLVFATATLLYSPARVDGARLLLKLAYPFLTFIVVVGVTQTRGDLERLMKWTLIGAVALALINPISVMLGGYHVDLEGRVRVQGVGAHQNPFSFYLLVMLLIGFARFTVRGQMRYLVLCAMLGAWMVLTLTRVTLGAALVGLVGAALDDAIIARKFRTVATAGVVGGALAVALVPIALERSFGYLPGPGELLALLADPVRLYKSINWQGREVIWPVIFNAFLSSPVIGLGMGSSTAVLLANFPPSMGGVIHNEYLRLLTDTGVVGAMLFVIAIATWLAGVIRVGRTGEASAREFTLPAFAGILAWAVISVSDNAFDYYAPFTQYIGFLCAGALVVERTRTQESVE